VAQRTFRAAKVPLRVHGRYDAAATTEENRRHWANADLLSANTANSPEVRRVLRSRARYEVANNSYARGIVLTLANDCIGTGPRLQMVTEDAEANRVVEQEFIGWAEAVGLAEKLRTLRMARAQDGEGFLMLVANSKVDSPVKLDLRLVEADQVATPDVERRSDLGNAIDGVVFDAYGNPVEYHLLKSHPGDGGAKLAMEYDPVPAASMIHCFRMDRPGQNRGIPEITPALPLFGSSDISGEYHAAWASTREVRVPLLCSTILENREQRRGTRTSPRRIASLRFPKFPEEPFFWGGLKA
jgi:capsid protein